MTWPLRFCGRLAGLSRHDDEASVRGDPTGRSLEGRSQCGPKQGRGQGGLDMTWHLRPCGGSRVTPQDEGADEGPRNLLTTGDSLSSLQLEREGKGTGLPRVSSS
jgi:hypothetical protein